VATRGKGSLINWTNGKPDGDKMMKVRGKLERTSILVKVTIGGYKIKKK